VLGFLLIWGTAGALLVRQLVLGVRREDALRASVLAALLGYVVLGMLENIIWDRHLWFFITVALFALPPTRADAPDSPVGVRRDGAPARRRPGRGQPPAKGGSSSTTSPGRTSTAPGSRVPTG
jgi:hypothetical protein